MSTNVGSIDRILRLIFGAALIAFAVFGGSVAALAPYATYAPYGWIGIVPIVTALVGWCPAYTLLGIRTCSRNAAGA
jgi:hypothetical protein